MNEKPFVKKFRIGNKFYIYDVNTNNFFAVERLVYDLIDRSGVVTEDSNRSREAMKKIAGMKKEGYFKSHRPRVSLLNQYAEGDFKAYLRDLHRGKVAGLTLVVTENCNLRCKYCAYSGNYTYHRNHSTQTMSSQTMKQAVDFYFAHSSSIPDEEKFISFYGGEPLLNLDLIKECVSYIKNKYKADMGYSTTINGTLLNREIMQFLIDHKFRVQVSVDGPKEIHDRNRLTREGKGSFSRVVESLKMFKALFPDFYKKNVTINAVLTAPLDVNRLNKFFADPEISTSGVRFSRVSQGITNGIDVHGQERVRAYEKDKQKVLKSFNGKLVRGEGHSLVEKMMFLTRYLYIHRRDMNEMPEVVPALGPCIPGERSVMVNADGTMNFCTQVDDVFTLGKVSDGFDYDGIEKIFRDMDNTFSRQCPGCWAVRLCRKCVKDVTKNGKVDMSQLQSFCKEQRRIILKEIKDYISIREQNPAAMDYLDELEFE